MVDLHTHTTASDGTYSPEQSVKRAKQKGLQALAITDHDTVGGVREAIVAGQKWGVEIIPGIEISSVHEGQDIHVLGYFVDYEDTRFLNRLTELRNVRNKRNQMMIAKFNELGIKIDLEEVQQKSKMPGGSIGRPHFAEALIDKGIVATMKEAFDVYLGQTGKAYVNPPRLTPQEAIYLIKDAGGVPVLAHPGIYDNEELVEQLLRNGLVGIEVYHPDHRPEQEEYFAALAVKYSVIQTAGSDFHGERNGVIFHGDLGSKSTGYETVSQLQQASKEIRLNR
ncbi:phosphatase [Ammoniphilus oxalaticus]|uniref:Phosphatase n=1 Tax=Ammoniphilus oxalaticus TaxID=66863 RepID=A0A419SJI2_9BACL|nr:PHP domain-containing protein [Ammoniphilus oxalaticus]RKD24058.1 phosphatase [Ammoniphilus oxalaticus]